MPGAWSTLTQRYLAKVCDQLMVELGLCSHFIETCIPAACAHFQSQTVPFQF